MTAMRINLQCASRKDPIRRRLSAKDLKRREELKNVHQFPVLSSLGTGIDSSISDTEHTLHCAYDDDQYILTISGLLLQNKNPDYTEEEEPGMLRPDHYYRRIMEKPYGQNKSWVLLDREGEEDKAKGSWSEYW